MLCGTSRSNSKMLLKNMGRLLMHRLNFQLLLLRIAQKLKWLPDSDTLRRMLRRLSVVKSEGYFSTLISLSAQALEAPRLFLFFQEATAAMMRRHTRKQEVVSELRSCIAMQYYHRHADGQSDEFQQRHEVSRLIVERPEKMTHSRWICLERQEMRTPTSSRSSAIHHEVTRIVVESPSGD